MSTDLVFLAEVSMQTVVCVGLQGVYNKYALGMRLNRLETVINYKWKNTMGYILN